MKNIFTVFFYKRFKVFCVSVGIT